jgi:hypothetical protein
MVDLSREGIGTGKHIFPLWLVGILVTASVIGAVAAYAIGVGGPVKTSTTFVGTQTTVETLNPSATVTGTVYVQPVVSMVTVTLTNSTTQVVTTWTTITLTTTTI